jgi:hypothetical protein
MNDIYYKAELERLLLQKLAGKTVDLIYDAAGNVKSRVIKEGGASGNTIKLFAPIPGGGRREVYRYGPLETINERALEIHATVPETIDGLLEFFTELNAPQKTIDNEKID